MPKSGKKLVAGKRFAVRMLGVRYGIYDRVLKKWVCAFYGRKYAIASAKTLNSRVKGPRLAAVVNAALKEVGKCQK